MSGPTGVNVDHLRNARVAVVTSDTDWVEEATMKQAHEWLCSLGVPLTYFVTQAYDVLVADAAVPVEIAPHPNFRDTDLLGEEVLRCLEFAPGAVSCRAHSCLWSERLRPILRRYGLKYSSAAMQYLQPGIIPSRIGHELTEIPLFWMDMFHLELCEREGRPPFDLDALGLDRPGLKVLDVHPVHLALNTRSLAHYEKAKMHYHDPERLVECRGEGTGMQTFFHDVVKRLVESGYEFCLLREVTSVLRRKVGSVQIEVMTETR